MYRIVPTFAMTLRRARLLLQLITVLVRYRESPQASSCQSSLLLAALQIVLSKDVAYLCRFRLSHDAPRYVLSTKVDAQCDKVNCDSRK